MGLGVNVKGVTEMSSWLVEYRARLRVSEIADKSQSRYSFQIFLRREMAGGQDGQWFDNAMPWRG